MTIEPLDIRVYDSLGTVVYTIAEAHQQADLTAEPDMVFATYVMIHERGEWRIAHIHAADSRTSGRTIRREDPSWAGSAALTKRRSNAYAGRS